MVDWTQFFQPSSWGFAPQSPGDLNATQFPRNYNFDDYAPQYRRESRYNELPASPNIDDRRGDPMDWWSHAVTTVTDLTPEQWGTVMRHPLTPFNELFRRDLPPGEYQDSPLAQQAGVNDIVAPQRRK
jgi:hypothetical protein